MRTFFITTLGCKVNQYESEQLATFLRTAGLVQVDRADLADLRIVNSCSVTTQAASKSRQAVRQLARPQQLPVQSCRRCSEVGHGPPSINSLQPPPSPSPRTQRVLVTGCWATSDKAEASSLPGVAAAIGHHDDVAAELDRLIRLWQSEDRRPPQPPGETLHQAACEPRKPESMEDGWMIQAGTPDQQLAHDNKSQREARVKKNLAGANLVFAPVAGPMTVVDAPPGRAAADNGRQSTGTLALPLLDARQEGSQRAQLKVQDGCDAHCTYCIIPKLRPRPWSKPVDDAVTEAQRLVDAGHREIVLTGIFLGAYGQATALRRRQRDAGPDNPSLRRLVEAMCMRVQGLRRLRLSSLEPGDLTEDLIETMQRYPAVVPHFHLPLQSGSDLLLRRMNRQYGRDDFLALADRVKRSFDRPAITTDIIVGFPGESDEEFQRTLDVVDDVKFLHIHAFPFSPRPGTAAARWRKDFVHSALANERIEVLRQRAMQHGLAYRRQFLGEAVEVKVERTAPAPTGPDPRVHHGRCERYFTVWFDGDPSLTGACVKVRIDQVTPGRTTGTLLEVVR